MTSTLEYEVKSDCHLVFFFPDAIYQNKKETINNKGQKYNAKEITWESEMNSPDIDIVQKFEEKSMEEKSHFISEI